MPIQLTTLLDTGKGQKLTLKRRVKPAWHSHIGPVQSSRLTDESKRVVKSCGPIHLTVHIGDFRRKVPFLVIQNLAVDCLAEKSFIDHHAKVVLTRIQKVVSYHCPSGAITSQRSLNKPKTFFTLAFEDHSQKFGQSGT